MKISSFFLAVLLLIQGNYWNMEDVSRIGELFEHAEYHADTFGDNFLVFLSKHYGELQQEHHEQNSEERPDHEELPFQNHCCLLIVADLSCFKTIYSLPNSVVKNNLQQNFHYQNNYASLASFEIFEPPRLT